MEKKRSRLNQSVEKTIQIIETMANAPGSMRLHDIATGCDIPPSTALRLVNTLLVYGYINQDRDTQRYALSLKFARLGDRVSEQVSLREVAHPLLVKLSSRCLESVTLACEEDWELVYMDVVDGPDDRLTVRRRIGLRAPLHATGTGKLLLLNYDGNQLEEYITRKGLPGLTPYTITTRQALLAALDEARRRDYAMDDEEYELGTRGLAVPIRDYSGRIIAGVAVYGPISRMAWERVEMLLPMLRSVADHVSNWMAYDGVTA